MRLPAVTLALLFAAGAAHGQQSKAVQRCADQLQADQTRIQREFVRERPSQADKAAFENWAIRFHAALNAAGRAAEACERASQPALTPERRATLEACIANVSVKSEALERQYAGRNLSFEEQTALRTARLELHDQRIACDLASRR